MPQITDLTVCERIGKGAFSEVFKGELKKTNAIVAIKVLTKIAECTKEEINYLERFSHPNIIHFYGTIQTDKLIIVTEYMDCTLDDLLYNQQTLASSLQFELTETVKTHLSIEIGKGINYLQQLHLIHGDIKPENILVNAHLDVKLSDFGLTKKPIECSENIHGTPNYLPPETYLYNEYNLTCDIYAFAMVIWQIFTRRLLFVKYKTVENLSMNVVVGERPPLTKAIPACYHELLQKMWSRTVEERPEITEILITLSEAYLEEFSNQQLKEQWKHLCQTYYGGIVQRAIPIEVLNAENDFSLACDGLTQITVPQYDFLSMLFGDLSSEVDVYKMNDFLSRVHIEFHWDERFVLITFAGNLFKVKENLFDDDWLEVEHLPSGNKFSIETIYHLVQ